MRLSTVGYKVLYWLLLTSARGRGVDGPTSPQTGFEEQRGQAEDPSLTQAVGQWPPIWEETTRNAQ